MEDAIARLTVEIDAAKGDAEEVRKLLRAAFTAQRIAAVRAIVSNTWKWGLSELATELGDPQFAVKDRFTRFAEAAKHLRNLDDKTLEVITRP